MENKTLINYYNDIKSYDCDYHEIFYENTIQKVYKYINNRLENINYSETTGIGITLSKMNEKFYGATNNFDELPSLIKNLGINFNKTTYNNSTILEKEYTNKYSHSLYSDEKKKKLLNDINEICRNYDKRIIQVDISLLEKSQLVKILSDNNLITDNRLLTRIIITVIAKDHNKTTTAMMAPGFSLDYSFLDNFDLEKEVLNTCKEAIDKLNVTPFKGGKMPVVIGPGFGAVIFHEACGHAMESYSIVDKTSIFTDKLNKKIASEKVTIIDDGTINGLYGTTNIDDQGEKTKKNILIKNGVLINYLTDKIDAKLLNLKSTGSARRENYMYSSTSRMNNTYLEKGNDKVEDMIKSIDYGLYAKMMGGGSVSPNTGEFNFVVNFGYIIKNGKLDKPVENISLVGDALDILNKVEMVSSDLSYGTGMCGALSGSVPVTIGEPTIKVSSILTGGNNE